MPSLSDIAGRAAGDEFLHEQLSDAAVNLRAAYRRGRNLRAEQAVADQKLYDRIRESASSLAAAGRRLAGTPEPEPPKRRRLPALAILVAVGVLVRSMHRRERAQATAA